MLHFWAKIWGKLSQKSSENGIIEKIKCHKKMKYVLNVTVSVSKVVI